MQCRRFSAFTAAAYDTVKYESYGIIFSEVNGVSPYYGYNFADHPENTQLPFAQRPDGVGKLTYNHSMHKLKDWWRTDGYGWKNVYDANDPSGRLHSMPCSAASPRNAPV